MSTPLSNAFSWLQFLIAGLAPNKLSGVRFSCTMIMIWLKGPCWVWATAKDDRKRTANRVESFLQMVFIAGSSLFRSPDRQTFWVGEARPKAGAYKLR